jgi:hypothetical protein
MRAALKKSARAAANASKSPLNGKARPFRRLKSFGLWADRADVKDPVQFTKAIRSGMEHGNDGR